MTFKTKYASYPNCEFVTNRYMNGNLALQVVSSEEGLITTCTVNPGEEIGDDFIAVKNYSENEGMDETLKEMGIIGEKVDEIPSGFVTIPVYKLTKKGKELFKDELNKVK